jgi:cytochrome c-type biogenesis protein
VQRVSDDGKGQPARRHYADFSDFVKGSGYIQRATRLEWLADGFDMLNLPPRDCSGRLASPWYPDRGMPSPQLDPATLLFALGAGLLSFVSPCVLPLLPAYLGYLSGLSAEELRTRQDSATRARVLSHALAFLVGLAAVFSLLGASASLLGRLLLDSMDLLTRAGGLLVVVLGLHQTGLVRIPLLYRELRADPARHSTQAAAGGWRGLLGALVMGAAFAAGWTPCVGPFLASLIALASQEETVGAGVLLLFVYALGLGLPFLLAGMALDRSLRLIQALKPRLHAIEVGSGVLLIGMGLPLVTERLALLSGWLVKVFGTGWAQ